MSSVELRTWSLMNLVTLEVNIIYYRTSGWQIFWNIQHMSHTKL